jgi:hypothetical protein
MILGGWQMLKHFLIVVLALGVLVWTAVAQTSASSNTNASATSNTSVDASKSGANVNSNNSANASQNLGVSHKDQDNRQNKERGKNTSASSSASGSAGGNAELSSGALLRAVLVKPVDARKSKEGDEVTAKVTEDVKADGQVIIKKNSKLIGHVTQAKARSKGEANAESSLGIVFDKAVLKDGREVPMHAVIQAVAAAQNTAAVSAGEDMSGMGSATAGRSAGAGGGVMGGVGSTVNNTAGSVGSTVGSTANTGLGTAGSATGNVGSTASAATQLNSNSRGMIGISGMNLVSEASSSTQGSLITSTSKNVKLDSGTQMLLRVSQQ